MKVVARSGRDDVAIVYIVEFSGGRLVECVEAIRPPLPREQKWVLLISTLFGCPIRCQMCDAASHYQGKLTKEEIFAQIDFLVAKRFPQGKITARQFKIQFARMGEPALNPAVLDVLNELPDRCQAPGLLPSLSTIAPQGTRPFFERLLEIKRKLYQGGHFQLQFSLHSTDPLLRDQLIPVKKWSFSEMAEYGERFFSPGDRKLTLNFALAQGIPVESDVLLRHFDPEKFLIKITPLNPTYRAVENRLSSSIRPGWAESECQAATDLRAAGYEVIVSIGETEENLIGSNCGQYLRAHLAAAGPIRDGYTYQISECSSE